MVLLRLHAPGAAAPVLVGCQPTLHKTMVHTDANEHKCCMVAGKHCDPDPTEVCVADACTVPPLFGALSEPPWTCSRRVARSKLTC